MTAVKLETNFASFPEVGHDGGKAFAAEVGRDFLDDCLERRDCCGLRPEDLRVCVPPEVAVINQGCKGAADSSPALRSPAHESVPPRMSDFPWWSGGQHRPIVTTTDATRSTLNLTALLRSILL